METGREKRFHDQVSWLMFVFSIFVIWVHSYNADLFSNGVQDTVWMAVDRIENFVSVGLGQIAVPGFFLLSSYLFFRNFSWEQLARKWKSRISSVVIPYVVWNLLYYLGYMAASRLLSMRSVVGRDVIPFTVQEIWRAIAEYAYAPIFWYLYQLIFLILFSPVIYLFVKNRITGICWLVGLVFAIHFHLDMRHPNTDALLYYSVAAYFAIHERELIEGDHGTASARKRCLAEGAAGILISVFCYRQMMTPGADVLWTCVYRMAVPMTCMVLSYGIRFPKIRPWMRQSMFLYAIHFVVVRFVNKGTAVLTHSMSGTILSAGIALIVYFLLPAIAVCVSYILAKLLVRYAPGIWRVLSGGRRLEG